MATDYTKALSKIPLFEGLSKRDLKRISSEMREETFNAGKEIVKEGQMGGRMYVILAGLCSVQVSGRKRGTLHTGDHFGVISMLDKGTRSASIIADGLVDTVSLSSWNFLAIMEEHPVIARKVMAELARLVRENRGKDLTH
jgi:CRP-like cAMP-binding protein